MTGDGEIVSMHRCIAYIAVAAVLLVLTAGAAQADPAVTPTERVYLQLSGMG
jgi:hypothetical protein